MIPLSGLAQTRGPHIELQRIPNVYNMYIERIYRPGGL